MIETDRLLLRRWQPSDREPFAAMNHDPQVMQYFPALLTPMESDHLIDRAEAHFEQHGFGPWAAELRGSHEFIGFIGLSIPNFEAPFMPAVEIGWRLASAHWGMGLATEGAKAAMRHGFAFLKLPGLVSFTVPANTPAYNSPISQADANSKALAYINGGAGQAYANANGSCTIVTGIPTFTESYGGHGGLLTFAVTPNIPNPGTSVLYWTDTTTGQTGSSAGAPGGFTSTFTDGHTYQFYFVCYGSGTPSSGTSATQTYYMP